MGYNIGLCQPQPTAVCQKQTFNIRVTTRQNTAVIEVCKGHRGLGGLQNERFWQKTLIFFFTFFLKQT